MPAEGEIRHPLFARVYDRLCNQVEPELAPRREELLDGLSGRVIEVGAGNGANFRFYPGEVSEVVAVEPEPYLRQRAERAAGEARVPVRVLPGLAERLPAADAEFDAAVVSLVLCSVGDQDAALAELRRALRPERELRFLEHVRAGGGRRASVQAWLDRTGIWPWLGGGCHCSRDTLAALIAAGFDIERVRRFELGPGWSPTNPHLIGVARVTRESALG